METDSAQPTTGVLVMRLRAGDRAALAPLENRYRDRLLRFCWGYLERMEEAEDAVQETFLRVIQATDVPEGFRPWIYKIARNQCLNILRDRGRRRAAGASIGASQLEAALTGQLTGMVRDETRRRIQEWMAQLSEAQREALRLRYVENLSRAEIAEVLETTESVVKSRLFEGLQRLRNWVRGTGESFGPSAVFSP